MFAVRRVILSGLLFALVGCPLDRDQPPPVAVVEGKPRVLVLPLQLGSTISPDGRFVRRRDPGNMPPEVGETAAVRLAADLGEAGVPLVDGSKVGAAAPADIGAATRTAAQAGANVTLVGALSGVRCVRSRARARAGRQDDRREPLRLHAAAAHVESPRGTALRAGGC